jgi:RNA polymerase sigma-70 factor (ECF subfamily)
VSTAEAPPRPDAELLEALRRGDESAFEELVERLHPSLVRLALSFVPSRAVAEDVAQETWLAVLRGLDGFEGRSSLKTWIFRILVNRAKTRGVREARSVPFSSLESGDSGPSVDADRFFDASHPRYPGGWSAPPRSWGELPEERLVARETLDVIRMAIAELPPAQRAAITLRDVEGLDSEEVASLLDVSPGNERVLLHRARSRVRAELERYLDDGDGTAGEASA